jgi:hypothetical protein
MVCHVCGKVRDPRGRDVFNDRGWMSDLKWYNSASNGDSDALW